MKLQVQSKELDGYLRTIRRLPTVAIEEIFDQKADDEFDPYDLEKCVCGWAVRAVIAKKAKTTASNISLSGGSPSGWGEYREPSLDEDESVPQACVRLFGGTEKEWGAIYNGVTNSDKMQLIDTALILRRMELKRKLKAINGAKR